MREPAIVERDAQPYVGRRETVTMTEFATVADHLPTMIGLLTGQGIPLAGAPFFRYRTIDMSADLVVEAGVPVAALTEVEEPMFVDTLPAGRYAVLTHVGHPDELTGAAARLLDWAQDRGLAWDVTPTLEGEVWGCRLEVALSNPAEEPDMHKWETVLMFRLAD